MENNGRFQFIAQFLVKCAFESNINVSFHLKTMEMSICISKAMLMSVCIWKQSWQLNWRYPNLVDISLHIKQNPWHLSWSCHLMSSPKDPRWQPPYLLVTRGHAMGICHSLPLSKPHPILWQAQGTKNPQSATCQNLKPKTIQQLLDCTNEIRDLQHLKPHCLNRIMPLIP